MREIKFRAWDKSWNMMFNNEILHKSGQELVTFAKIHSTNPAIQNAYGGLLLPTDDANMIFMQYTGLQDANGVEIYEGDIVAVACDCDPGDYAVCNHPPAITYVGWCQENASFELWDAAGKLSNEEFSDDYQDVYTVIGNIYENLELLNKDGEA